MRNNSLLSGGGAKKFLYSGPKKTDDDDDDIQWNFNKNSSPRGNGQINLNKPGIDIDEAWNIRRNVNIGAPHKGDSLTFNVNKNYYSRHGGSKDKDEVGSSTSNTSTITDANQGTSGKSWNLAAGQSRRPFSYSFGLDQANASEKPVSPRNTSNSSFANYPPVGNVNNNFGSVSSRESVGPSSKEPFGSTNYSFGTMSSREPKTSQLIGGTQSGFTNSKTGQSLNSFSQNGNTNSNFGQSKTTQSQVYSNSVFNGSIFSKNNTPW